MLCSLASWMASVVRVAPVATSSAGHLVGGERLLPAAGPDDEPVPGPADGRPEGVDDDLHR